MMIAYKAGQVDEKTAFNSTYINSNVENISYKEKYNKLYSEDLY